MEQAPLPYKLFPCLYRLVMAFNIGQCIHFFNPFTQISKNCQDWFKGPGVGKLRKKEEMEAGNRVVLSLWIEQRDARGKLQGWR